MNQNEYFCKLLLKNKKINKKTYQELSKNFEDKNFDCLEFLVEKKYITEHEKTEILSKTFDMPMVDLDLVNVSINFEKWFNLEIMQKFQFIPIYISKENTMIVATSEPSNLQMQSVVNMYFDGKVEFVLAEKTKIKNFLNSYLANISSKDALSSIVENKTNEEKQNDDEILVQNAPAVKFVDSIIREALPLRASDIHIEPNEENVVIKYRIDGDLIKWSDFPILSYSEISARIKILSGIDIAEKRIPQDGRILMNINGDDINFRVSTLPTIYGEKFVIRVLDNKVFSYTLKELNFSKKSYELIDKILSHPHGIILLTGPTGSGKTTTLYAFLRELNSGKKNIVTIEDPVEYAMDGVNQVQVNKKADLTFASSLRSILRQDPDIIMVGEIRDEETAQIAIRSAITGHLVLSTLHTNDAPGAVIRLTDMGIPQYLVGDALVAVISQRLVKKLCPHCKKKIKTNAQITNELDLKESTFIYEPNGCPYCNNTGYRGRMAVHEIMYIDHKLKEKLNFKNLDFETLRDLAIKNGMITISKACKEYVLNGTTSFAEYVNISLGNK